MASYETDLQNLKTAQRNAAIADLENTRNKALSDLQAEQRQNAGTYNAQRNTANTQNRMSAKNFQEYLASTGRANSGLSSQAKMQYGNNLSTSINNLNAGEAAALADINRRTTDAQNAYNTGLAGANAQIEADYISNLMNERNKDLERQMQEKQYQESVRQYNLNKALQERQLQESIRQFNENLALQKQQLQSRFSSGSGGGGGYTRTSNNKNTNTNKTVAKQQTLSEKNKSLRDAAKVGEYYVKSVKTSQGGIADQLWRKTKNGKDVRVR